MSAEASKQSPSAMKRFGPLAVLVLLAQLGIAWVLIQTLLTPEKVETPAGDEMMAQKLMGERQDAGEDQSRGDLPFYYAPPDLHRVAVNPAGTSGERVMVVAVELGLRAYDRSQDPPKEITGTLAAEADMLAVLDRYASRMRAITNEILSRKRIEDIEGGKLPEIAEQIRSTLNHDVMRPAFPRDESDKYVTIAEVLFPSVIIQ